MKRIIKYYLEERKGNNINKNKMQPTRTLSSKTHILDVQTIGNCHITQIILIIVL